MVRAQNAAPNGLSCFIFRSVCELRVISKYKTTPVTAVLPMTSKAGKLIASHEWE
jgi:hypothetical protein